MGTTPETICLTGMPYKAMSSQLATVEGKPPTPDKRLPAFPLATLCKVVLLHISRRWRVRFFAYFGKVMIRC